MERRRIYDIVNVLESVGVSSFFFCLSVSGTQFLISCCGLYDSSSDAIPLCEKILVRKAKNRYTWIGFGGVPMALRELKVCV